MLAGCVSTPVGGGPIQVSNVPTRIRYRHRYQTSWRNRIAYQAGSPPSGVDPVSRMARTSRTLSSKNDSPNDVVFSLYDGRLYRITIKYDRYERERDEQMMTCWKQSQEPMAAFCPRKKPFRFSSCRTAQHDRENFHRLVQPCRCSLCGRHFFYSDCRLP